MKKLLLLGGSAQQIVAIEKAKKLGYYTILCDYLDDNPGQTISDKFYLESTTDKEAILKIAQKENIDGIVAYASDPAAPTAAYVAEKLSLPTNSYEVVTVLSEKHKFRKYLLENHFNVPNSCNFIELTDKNIKKVSEFKFPIMVKPVDSSGSKGIRKIYNINDLEEAVKYSKQFSRNNIIQVEEYIEKDHKYMVGGDIFVVNGEIKFWGLLNCHRDNLVNPLVPVGKSFPLHLSHERQILIKTELNKLIKSLNIKFGAFNVELMITKNNKVYFIEVGPRNGGNMIPDLLSMISGIDLITATIKFAAGDQNFIVNFNGNNKFFATHNLHSNRDGIYKDIIFSPKLEAYIIRKNIYKEQGDYVKFFDGANKALGIIFMEFNTENEMNTILLNINDYINIILE
ncbi:ATP-grasp domain-containing protein [Clostridium botulinum]|uniref:ATP-grasp domain-containing protein n=1 Tax=Clostridium botulinum TaxID=1491 RepID=UPI001967F644|nr:ATP-grasp domain-containing protein [Clostridium botulinum]MBN1066202.1 ATP-grasp domain-containing protein [Clostridium botulinum]